MQNTDTVQITTSTCFVAECNAPHTWTTVHHETDGWGGLVCITHLDLGRLDGTHVELLPLPEAARPAHISTCATHEWRWLGNAVRCARCLERS